MIKQIYIVSFVVLCGFLGCTDNSQSDLSPSASAPVRAKARKECFLPSPIISAIGPQDPILRVNGVDITKAQYDCQYRIAEKIFRKSNGIGMFEQSDKVTRYMRSIKYDILMLLLRRELVKQAAGKMGLMADEKEIAKVASRFLQHVREPKKNLKRVLASFLTKDETETQLGIFASDALGELYLRSWSTNNLDVISDVELSNQVHRINTVNAEMRSLNEKSRQRAAAAKKEILDGGNFYEVTTNRCDLVPEQGREWETLELGELEPEEDLFRFLCTAKQGDISDPLDFDDGIGIVGVVLKEKGYVPEGDAAPDEFTLVRCLFTAYTLHQIPDDLEELRQRMLEDRCSRERVALGKELTDSAVVEYPHGEQIFKKDAKRNKARKNSGKAKVNKARGRQK